MITDLSQENSFCFNNIFKQDFCDLSYENEKIIKEINLKDRKKGNSKFNIILKDLLYFFHKEKEILISSDLNRSVNKNYIQEKNLKNTQILNLNQKKPFIINKEIYDKIEYIKRYDYSQFSEIKNEENFLILKENEKTENFFSLIDFDKNIYCDKLSNKDLENMDKFKEFKSLCKDYVYENEINKNFIDKEDDENLEITLLNEKYNNINKEFNYKKIINKEIKNSDDESNYYNSLILEIPSRNYYNIEKKNELLNTYSTDNLSNRKNENMQYTDSQDILIISNPIPNCLKNLDDKNFNHFENTKADLSCSGKNILGYPSDFLNSLKKPISNKSMGYNQNNIILDKIQNNDLINIFESGKTNSFNSNYNNLISNCEEKTLFSNLITGDYQANKKIIQNKSKIFKRNIDEDINFYIYKNKLRQEKSPKIFLNSDHIEEDYLRQIVNEKIFVNNKNKILSKNFIFSNNTNDIKNDNYCQFEKNKDVNINEKKTDIMIELTMTEEEKNSKKNSENTKNTIKLIDKYQNNDNSFQIDVKSINENIIETINFYSSEEKSENLNNYLKIENDSFTNLNKKIFEKKYKNKKLKTKKNEISNSKEKINKNFLSYYNLDLTINGLEREIKKVNLCNLEKLNTISKNIFDENNIIGDKFNNQLDNKNNNILRDMFYNSKIKEDYFHYLSNRNKIDFESFSNNIHKFLPLINEKMKTNENDEYNNFSICNFQNMVYFKKYSEARNSINSNSTIHFLNSIILEIIEKALEQSSFNFESKNKMYFSQNEENLFSKLNFNSRQNINRYLTENNDKLNNKINNFQNKTEFVSNQIVEENFRKFFEKPIFSFYDYLNTFAKINENICQICNNGDYQEESIFYFCNFCQMAVHPNCYGIFDTKPDEFKCDVCLAFQNHKEKIHNVECILCPVTGGAMKRSNIKIDSKYYRKLTKIRKINCKNNSHGYKYKKFYFELNNLLKNERNKKSIFKEEKEILVNNKVSIDDPIYNEYLNIKNRNIEHINNKNNSKENNNFSPGFHILNNIKNNHNVLNKKLSKTFSSQETNYYCIKKNLKNLCNSGVYEIDNYHFSKGTNCNLSKINNKEIIENEFLNLFYENRMSSENFGDIKFLNNEKSSTNLNMGNLNLQFENPLLLQINTNEILLNNNQNIDYISILSKENTNLLNKKNSNNLNKNINHETTRLSDKYMSNKIEKNIRKRSPFKFSKENDLKYTWVHLSCVLWNSNIHVVNFNKKEDFQSKLN